MPPAPQNLKALCRNGCRQLSTASGFTATDEMWELISNGTLDASGKSDGRAVRRLSAIRPRNEANPRDHCEIHRYDYTTTLDAVRPRNVSSYRIPWKTGNQLSDAITGGMERRRPAHCRSSRYG
ncbi:hypothetical protein KCP78_11570 [Salmonella enterica subsp. enterica]|nr:hypothetical protein KCP78_11570 [Salmonella enterica subsp. enterica]